MAENVVGVKSYSRRSKSGKVVSVQSYHQKRDQASELMKLPGRPQMAATAGQYGAGRSVPNQGVPSAKAAAKPAPAPTKQEIAADKKTAERAGFKVTDPLKGKAAEAVARLHSAGHKVETDKEKLKAKLERAVKKTAAAKKASPAPAKKTTPSPAKKVVTKSDLQVAVGKRGTGLSKGTADDPINVAGNVQLAAKYLAEGKHVRLNRIDEVGTLLDELRKVVEDMKAKGEKAPNYDLCKVSVPKTNLFCAESKGVPRLKMPQLGGFPEQGSRADALPKKPNGKVNVTDQFREAVKKHGVSSRQTTVRASFLKASQAELDGPKVAEMMHAIEQGKIKPAPIFVTRDGYIIDGHHRWAANVGTDTRDNKLGDVEMPVEMLDMEIGEALDFANAFSSDFGIKPRGLGADAGGTHTPAEDKAADYKRRAVVAAKDVIDKAKAAEKGTTDVIQKTVKAQQGHMEGLDFRFKTQESLQRKLRDKALSRGITPEEYAAKVADALRYTAVFNADNYVTAAQQTLADLEKQGHKVVSVENSWGKGSGYSGTNVELKASNGLSWELQFHTPESFDLKEHRAHVMYEKVRDLELAYDLRFETYMEMVKLWDALPQPKGWDSFGDVIDRKDAPVRLSGAVAHLEGLLLKLSSVNPPGRMKVGGRP